jgi:hypothetical protein
MMTIHDLSPTTDVEDRRTHELPTPTVEVSVWSDPVVDRLGHDPRSTYVERFWLPIMGPSTVWFLRRMADDLDRAPEGFTLDLAEMALGLGVGLRGGRNAPMLRTIDRSCRFGAARPHGPGAIAVRRHLAPLTRSQVERLPARLQAEHGAWLARPKGSAAYPELLQRARTIALTLVEIGTTPVDAERHLHALRFHPAIAHDAVRWALARSPHTETDEPISR